MRWIVYALLAANGAFFVWQAARAPVTAARPPAAAPDYSHRLLRLGEIDPAELRPRARAAPPEPLAGDGEAGPAADAPAARCYGIGPVAGDEVIERMRVWLEEEGAATRLRVDERREIELYWIHLPPFESQAAAREQVAEMRAKGLEDISVIRRGDMANAVSLGVYSRQSSLERRLRELEALGYDPAVAPRYRTEKATWYDVTFPAGAELPAERFARAFPAAEVAEAPCPASETALRPSGLPRREADDAG